MSSHLTQLADAVVAAVTASLGGPFQVSRRWVPRITKADFATAPSIVFVSPRSDAAELASRSQVSRNVTIDVALFVNLPGQPEGDEAAIDAFVESVEKLKSDLFAGELAAGDQNVVAIEIEQEMIIDRKRVEEQRYMFTLLAVTYPAWFSLG